VNIESGSNTGAIATAAVVIVLLARDLKLLNVTDYTEVARQRPN
jgi:hypothetical protein